MIPQSLLGGSFAIFGLVGKIVFSCGSFGQIPVVLERALYVAPAVAFCLSL